MKKNILADFQICISVPLTTLELVRETILQKSNHIRSSTAKSKFSD